VRDEGPTAFDLPELGGSVRLVDVGRERGLAGEVISEIDGQETVEGAEIVVQFRSGRAIRYRSTGSIGGINTYDIV
jgi:hypothetical protein